MPAEKMERVAYQHSWGDDGEVEIELNLKYLRELDDEDRNIARRAVQDVLTKLHVRDRKTLPKYLEETKQELQNFQLMFSKAGLDTVWFDRLPNGYCGDDCCPHLPWYRVTTIIGHFKIGWRKRVIHLEWADTRCKKTAEDLFPESKDTKEKQMIHCWSYEAAAERIKKIMENV